MKVFKILIVEDEILIADTLKRYLEKSEYEVLDICVSYEEAVEVYQLNKPDLALLDIRLSGQKSGVDVARFINAHEYPCPFVYLTSQIDSVSINEAKQTNPDGYLPKPIRKDTLLTTAEIILHNSLSKAKKSVQLVFTEGNKKYNVKSDDILFIQADHIYVEIYLRDQRKIIQRSSIKEIVELVPKEDFIQTHRSYIINIAQVDIWDSQNLIIANHKVPVSRSRKKEVLQKLDSYSDPE